MIAPAQPTDCLSIECFPRMLGLLVESNSFQIEKCQSLLDTLKIRVRQHQMRIDATSLRIAANDLRTESQWNLEEIERLGYERPLPVHDIAALQEQCANYLEQAEWLICEANKLRVEANRLGNDSIAFEAELMATPVSLPSRSNPEFTRE